MNVFTAVKNAPPIIARKDDCQTCYICELYCPVDALYVAPNAADPAPVSEDAVASTGLLGSSRGVGWAATQALTLHRWDQSFRLTSLE